MLEKCSKGNVVFKKNNAINLAQCWEQDTTPKLGWGVVPISDFLRLAGMQKLWNRWLLCVKKDDLNTGINS